MLNIIDPTESSRRLALTLHRATALLDRVAEAYLRPAHGLGVSSFAVLITVDALGAARQSAVARGLGVSRAAVTQRLAPLVSRGLIRVVADPSHAGANVVSLTPAGSQLLSGAWQGLGRLDDGVEEGVDVEALQAALDRMIANAERFLGSDPGV